MDTARTGGDARACARLLFDYERVEDAPCRADGIVAFGNHDTHVAQRAAELYLDGVAPYIVFSGGLGRITRGIWHEPEAERFRGVAVGMGVPERAVFVEPRSSNTGENIRFTQELMEREGLAGDRLIAVDRPYRLRRTRAALEAQWPGAAFAMAAPALTFDDYCAWYRADGPIGVDDFFSLLVGDVQRLVVYGERGFQAPQQVPGEVMDAYRRLVELGFTGQMLPPDEGRGR